MNPISSLVFVLLLTVFPTQIICTPLIDQASDKLSAASFHLSYSNYNLVKARMTEATVNRQSCDQVFQGKHLKSPLSESTSYFSEMQNNVESIIGHL
ncbi:hypothetical protein CFP56_037545 [Quercus suber]|uniref:Pectinesterase inhibitor domain-containing protein n=1 Tax=Quercus suber TaxID=58331 RepID=A0AAW0J580_QUESU